MWHTIFKFLNNSKYAFLVFAFFATLTYVSWGYVSNVVDDEVRDEFERISNDAISEVEKELGIYTSVLSGLNAFFQASDFIDEEEFGQYADTDQIFGEHPGIRSVLFVENRSALVSREGEVSEVYSFENGINENNTSEDYYPVIYLKDGPNTQRELDLHGYDMGQIPAALEAIEEVNTSGRMVVMSAPFAGLYQDTIGADFLIVHPYSVEGDIQGYFVLLVDTASLFTTVDDNLSLFSMISISLFDEGDTLFQEDPGYVPSDRKYRYQKEISFGGNTWLVYSHATEEFIQEFQAERYLPGLVLFFGLSIAGLLYSVIYLLARSRDAARELAEKMTKNYKQEQERTERQNIQLQRALSDTEALKSRLEIAKLAAGFGVWDWDLETNELTWDDQMYVLYGTERGEHDDMYTFWEQTIHPEDREETVSIVQNGAKEGLDLDYDFRVVLPNGLVRYMKAKAIVVKEGPEDHRRMVGVNYDITHEKEVDRAKTEFVSLASHQLRTPLSSIKWYAEMLMDGDAGEINDTQKEYLGEIYRGNERMVALVEALLNVSRIDLGTFIIEPSEVDPDELLAQELDMFTQTIEQKELNITTTIDDIEKVSADEKMLGIMFQNLLSNAIKYTPKGGNIQVSLIDKDKETMQFEVADDGYGIPKKQRDKIFTKLFRADNVKEMDTDGTGLGLYIVKAILTKIDGEIDFTSEEGKGTTFTLTIPKTMKPKDGDKSLSV